ncbi:MAG: hypothetical protein PVH63_09350 [Balneolaceae bacterium]|jgi:CcmD family protein
MIFSLIQAQEDTTAAVDTLTKSYSQKWEAASNLQHANPVIKAASSHDLIFIVLGVSLIIWFVLLFFIIRLDKKVGKLENEIDKSNVKLAP